MTQRDAAALLIGYGVRCAARATPDKVALTDLAGNRRTHAELDDRARRIGVMARDGYGLARGDRVVLAAPNRLEYAECVMGLADAGIAVVTVNPASTPDELEYILNHSSARLVLADAAVVDKLQTVVAGDVPVLDMGDPLGKQLDRVAADVRCIDAEETDVFAISYTSGTTGEPKGVLLSHRARTSMFLLAIAATYGTHTPAIRALTVSPYFNGGGLAHLLAPLYFGGSVQVVSRFDAAVVVEALKDGTTFAALVPTQLTAMLDVHGWGDMPALAALVTNSAAAPQRLKEQLIERLGPNRLYDSYGSTECGVTSVLRPDQMLVKPRSIGRPVPGAMMTLLNEAGEEVESGEVGELACRMPWLFSGYLHESDGPFGGEAGGWCRTGDLATRDEDGFYFVAGRKKQVIITGGQNVFPAEVENAIARHPAIREVAVVGVSDAYWGEAVSAAYTLHQGVDDVSAADLRDFLRSKVTGYKVPKHFVNVKVLPKNATGKILHREVQQAVTQHLASLK